MLLCRFCVTAMLCSILVFLGGCGQNSLATQAAMEEDQETDGSDAEKVAEEAGPRTTNRLSRETSPYLLLHAHNPVDWYPWGPEAFETARREKKPIFLSIGYSSCYWCHVMERLSFSNPEIAKFMNEHFVNIKVDREERPDVDDIYMTSCIVYFQAIGSSQGGGWPLSLFLTPAGKPFAGGTYFPPESENGRLGFADVLRQIQKAWKEQPDAIRKNADTLTREVQRAMKPRLSLEKVELTQDLVSAVVDPLMSSSDPDYGGIDFNPQKPNGPKFPVPAKLELLQYQSRRHGDEQALGILKRTLDGITRGGIRDHLGGGFHRYSTDREWLIPHFEKMLYDQAQLSGVLVDAFRQTGDTAYRRAAIETIDFVLRDLRDPESEDAEAKRAFHSALDAETDQVEGKYYVWSIDEVDSVLGDDAQLFRTCYGVIEPVPFEEGFVLHLPDDLATLADRAKLDMNTLQIKLERCRERLLEKRSKRELPLKDDKILTSWNGLMIRALASAGSALNRPDYVAAAEQAALFILTRMRDREGRLQRTFRADQSRLNAYLDDYAFLVQGLLALHEATRDNRWLNAARKLTDEQIELFWDTENDGFYFTMHHHEELIARTKNAYDAVLPSGNSVSVRNLIRLASLTEQSSYRDYARKTLEVFAPELQRTPRGLTHMALALAEYLDDPDFRTGLIPGPESDTAPIAGSVSVESGGEDPGPPFDDADAIRLVGLQQETESREPETERNGKTAEPDELISARAYLEYDRVPVDRVCRIAIVIDIADDWHINANPAQPDYLTPTEIEARSEGGCRFGKWVFPKAESLAVESLDETFHVYETQIVVFGTVKAEAALAGQSDDMTCSISYQACNNSKCLTPAVCRISGRFAVAEPGQPVRAINGKLFRLAPPVKSR